MRTSPIRHSDSLLRPTSIASKASFGSGFTPEPQNENILTRMVNLFRSNQSTSNERQSIQTALFDPYRIDRPKPIENQEFGPTPSRVSEIDLAYRYNGPAGNRKSLHSNNYTRAQ